MCFSSARPAPAIPVDRPGTDSLARTAWRDQLAKAKDVYGDDADVMTRLNVRSAVRVAEQDDLIEEHSPPMNAEARA